MLQAFPIVFSDNLHSWKLAWKPQERLIDAVCRCVSFSNWSFWGSMLVLGGCTSLSAQSQSINNFWAGLTRQLHKRAKLQDNEALTIYTQIVKNKQYPFSGRFRVNMGNIYFKQEKWTAAIKMYRMALDQIPNNVQATLLGCEIARFVWRNTQFLLFLSEFSNNGHTKHLRYFSFNMFQLQMFVFGLCACSSCSPLTMLTLHLTLHRQSVSRSWEILDTLSSRCINFLMPSIRMRICSCMGPNIWILWPASIWFFATLPWEIKPLGWYVKRRRDLFWPHHISSLVKGVFVQIHVHAAFHNVSPIVAWPTKYGSLRFDMHALARNLKHLETHSSTGFQFIAIPGDEMSPRTRWRAAF